MNPTNHTEHPPWVKTVVEASKGCILGGVVVAVVKPGLYMQNRRQLKQPIVRSQAYKGTALMAGAAVPQAAISFFVNQMIKNIFFEGLDDNQLSLKEKAFCSLFAGAASGVITTPIEKVVVNMENGWKSSAFEVFKGIHQQEGIQGHSKGARALLCREALYVAGYRFLNGYANDQVQVIFPDLNPTVCEVSTAALSGAFVGAMTAPLNVLRVNKQSMDKQWSYTRIFRELGVKGMTRAMGTRAVALAAATVIMTCGENALES